MSVIIKGMAMPETCSDCPLEYDCIWCSAIEGDDGYFMDKRYGENGFDTLSGRLPCCPLEEVRG